MEKRSKRVYLHKQNRQWGKVVEIAALSVFIGWCIGMAMAIAIMKAVIAMY